MILAALASRIGSNHSYISKEEKGQTEPLISTFYRIMNALGVRIEYTMHLGSVYIDVYGLVRGVY